MPHALDYPSAHHVFDVANEHTTADNLDDVDHHSTVDYQHDNRAVLHDDYNCCRRSLLSGRVVVERGSRLVD